MEAPMYDGLKPATVMIVDDSRTSLHLLKQMLLKQDFIVKAFPRPEPALMWALENPPDLILLDIVMPGMDGFELCRLLKAEEKLKDVPVIFISSKSEIKSKVMAFGIGGVDYITRPFELEEVRTRVSTHLRIRRMQLGLMDQNRELERLVAEKVKEISDSRMATILALAKLAESRDDDTGKHLERVQGLCTLLAERLSTMPGCQAEIDREFIENIFYASPLHDIGKVGIPDRILLKPGRLDPDEFEVMKRHTVIGAETLEAVRERYRGNAFIEMGISIARSHHEWWDGSGYPDGLRGDAIPLCARIMAVADVYDALRSERSYKHALPHDRALEIIRAERGTHFCPCVVDAFLSLEADIVMAYEGADTKGSLFPGGFVLKD
ncbi:MAG TPA: response regulator [Deltaproteobacteria bacterium]|nr:response regulator [Deltaproteobacteria bacterium]